MEWTFEDEKYWQSLIASEPAKKQNWRENTLLGKEENTNMINLQRNNTPQGNEVPKGIQFLSPRHVLTAQGFKAEIYKVTTDKPDNFGNPVVVYFKAGTIKYSKGFKLSSDLLATLVDLLGADESKWTKKVITIGKMVDDNGGERLTFSR